MLDMHNRVGDSLMASYGQTELRHSIAVRIICDILFPLLLDGHTAAIKGTTDSRQARLKVFLTLVGYNSRTDEKQSRYYVCLNLAFISRPFAGNFALFVFGIIIRFAY